MNVLDSKITYNNYEVLSAKRLDKIIFVKAYDKTSGKIFWFLGFETKQDFISDIKRILIDDKKYTNEYFKQMFQDDYLFKPSQQIIFDDSGFIQHRKRKEIF